MNNWSTERLTVTANSQNTLQHFQGASAPLPMSAGAHHPNRTYLATFYINTLWLELQLQWSVSQARSQHFTLGSGGGGWHGSCEGALFSEKLTTFFSRRPQNLSSGWAHTTLLVERTLLLFWIKQALRPNKTSFFRKKSTQSTIGGHDPLPPGYAPTVLVYFWGLYLLLSWVLGVCFFVFFLFCYILHCFFFFFPCVLCVRIRDK